MIRPQSTLSDGDGATGQRLAFGVATTGMLQPTQVMVNGGYVGMVWPKHTLKAGQRPAIKLFRFVEASHVLVKDAQAIAELGYLQVIGIKRLLRPGQCLLVELIGHFITPLVATLVRFLTPRPNLFDCSAYFIG